MEDNNIDLNVGGKIPERFQFFRDEEIPEFTEEEKEAIKNFLPNRKEGDKFGCVLLLGTGGESSGLHAARTFFMDDKKDAADYIVTYDPIIEGGSFSMYTKIENGVAIHEPGCFRKIEGPGTVLSKKKVKAKNRYKSQIKKSVENFRKNDVSEYYARTTMLPPLDPDKNMLPDTVDKF